MAWRKVSADDVKGLEKVDLIGRRSLLQKSRRKYTTRDHQNASAGSDGGEQSKKQEIQWTAGNPRCETSTSRTSLIIVLRNPDKRILAVNDRSKRRFRSVVPFIEWKPSITVPLYAWPVPHSPLTDLVSYCVKQPGVRHLVAFEKAIGRRL